MAQPHQHLCVAYRAASMKSVVVSRGRRSAGAHRQRRLVRKLHFATVFLWSTHGRSATPCSRCRAPTLRRSRRSACHAPACMLPSYEGTCSRCFTAAAAHSSASASRHRGRHAPRLGPLRVQPSRRLLSRLGRAWCRCAALSSASARYSLSPVAVAWATGEQEPCRSAAPSSMSPSFRRAFVALSVGGRQPLADSRPWEQKRPPELVESKEPHSRHHAALGSQPLRRQSARQPGDVRHARSALSTCSTATDSAVSAMALHELHKERDDWPTWASPVVLPGRVTPQMSHDQLDGLWSGHLSSQLRSVAAAPVL